MSRAPVKAGDIIADKYRVDHVLGSGAMGIVVAATHLDLLEPRALKFMSPTALANADAASRFQREARAAAKLKSEYIAKVYDVSRLNDGTPYMVMEYLEGSDLDAVLKKVGVVATPVATLYALQVCAALAEAHAVGIIHRDLKPANLFLTTRTDGSPCIKVLDFGISKNLAPGAEGDVTKTKELLGTPFFMSPEQMQSTRSADSRSDIWSLGVILYKLVTGNVPFAAKSIAQLVGMVLSATPTPPSKLNPSLPSGMDAVILRCLRRSREERYANVVELAVDLERFAPPDAAGFVKTMGRVFSTSGSMQRPSTTAFAAEEASRAMASPIPGRPPAAKRSTSELAAAVAPVLSPSPVPLAQVSMLTPPSIPAIVPPEGMASTDATTVSWDRRKGQANSRSHLPVILGVVVGIIVLAVVGLVLALTSRPQTPGVGEEVTTTKVLASTPVPSVKLMPRVLYNL